MPELDEPTPDLEDALEDLRNAARRAAQTVGNDVVGGQVRGLAKRLWEAGTGGTSTRRKMPKRNFANGGRLELESDLLPLIHLPAEESSMIGRQRRRVKPPESRNGLESPEEPSKWQQGSIPDEEIEI